MDPGLASEVLKPWGPWWSLLWAGVVICIWTVAQGLFSGVFIVMDRIKGNGEKRSSDEILQQILGDGDLMGSLAFASAMVGCLMILIIVKVRGTSFAEGLALRAPKWWVWLVLPFATLALLYGLNLVITPLQGEKAAGDQGEIVSLIRETDWLILLLLGVAVGAPFFEEFLFRGLLHEGLKQSFLGVWGSAIVTGLAFSAMHMQYEDPSAFLFLFLLGVALVAARELTGSLWVPIAIHAAQNTLATIPIFLVLNGVIPEEQVPAEFKELIEAAEVTEVIEGSAEEPPTTQ